MAFKIYWSKKAEKSYQKVIVYLVENWSPRVADNFIVKSENTLVRIAERPYSFPRSISDDIHEALITKHNLVLYKISENRIQIILIWDTRMNPKKKRI